MNCVPVLIPGGKGGRCVRLTLHHSVPLSRNLGTLTFWNLLGLSRPVMGLLYLYLSSCILISRHDHVLRVFWFVKVVPKYLNSSTLSKVLLSILTLWNLKIKIYRTIILPVVLYGCETWSLTLREERRLRVFENKVFRRIFGPRRDEVTGDWRRLH